jgi:hypothetical protein
MRFHGRVLLVAWTALAVSSAATAQQQFVYPAKGQTSEQQARDEGECQQWAVQQSGFDPARPQVAAAAQPAPVTGSGARMRGAVGGAAVASVTGGDVSDGAAAGAVAGGVIRRNKNRAAAAKQNEVAAQAQRTAEDNYARARAVCLEGRGYTVK